jgi:hypothetical protein
MRTVSLYTQQRAFQSNNSRTGLADCFEARDPAVKAEIIGHLLSISPCKQASKGFSSIEIQ